MSAGVVPVDDRGLNYGDGLFETMRASAGRLPLLERHLGRLEAGCARVGIPWPGRVELAAELEAEAARIVDGVVKLVVTRGSGGRGYAAPAQVRTRRIVTSCPAPDYPRDNYTQGVAVRVCETRIGHSPATAGLKHLGRLEQVLASSEPDRGAAEGLMLDPAGRIVEGVRSNLFLVHQDVIITPELTRAGVEGVMRAEVLDVARQDAIHTSIEDVSIDHLTAAGEAFLCNSVFGIWPVRVVLDVADFAAPGRLTRRLMTAVARRGVPEWMP